MHALIIALACLAAEPAHAKATKPAPRPRTEQQLIVVAEDQLAAANAAAVAVAGPRAANTFAIRYQDETGKQTYYVCSWRMTADQAARFAALLAEQTKSKKAAIYKEAKGKGKTADDSKFSGSAAAKLTELKLEAIKVDPKEKDKAKETQ